MGDIVKKWVIKCQAVSLGTIFSCPHTLQNLPFTSALQLRQLVSSRCFR